MRDAETKEHAQKKPVAFLACSTETTEVLGEAIQELLSRVALVRAWHQGGFPPSTYVPDQIVAQASTFDYAIMLLSADDLIELRGKRFITARDNVVFETGLLMAFVGRERTFLLVPDIEDMHIPTDLAGLTKITYPAGLSAETATYELGPACRKMRSVIEKLGKRFDLPDLSGGMYATLGAFEQADKVKHSQVTALLAKYNGEVLSSNVSGWEKAADYVLHHLEHLGLLEKLFSRRDAAKLTEKGKRLLAAPRFKDRFKDFIETRGVEVPRILDEILRKRERPIGPAKVSRPDFRR